MTHETLLAVVIACIACLSLAGTALACLKILRDMWNVLKGWNKKET
ncbi:MAG TPA: hypothetical protein H9774_11680 [Candidatus Desulfovibrio gallistercoris]|nr:hypothetical protein [Candidatus Desulfovibrio gallistercoris]